MGPVFAASASQVLSELSSAIKTVRTMSATPQQTLTLGYTIGAGLDIVPKPGRRADGGGQRSLSEDRPDVTAELLGRRPIRIYNPL